MKLIVQIENSRRREAYAVEVQGEAQLRSGLGLRLVAWLASCLSDVGGSGVCKSFTVSVHNLNQPGCGHEVGNVDAS